MTYFRVEFFIIFFIPPFYFYKNKNKKVELVFLGEWKAPHAPSPKASTYGFSSVVMALLCHQHQGASNSATSVRDFRRRRPASSLEIAQRLILLVARSEPTDSRSFLSAH